MKNKATLKIMLASAALCLLAACGGNDSYFKNDYTDNSPTSGRLKVYYDEGVELHIKNQALTFESQYPNASIELVMASESDAVQALYKDSCQAIVISRQLNDNERKAFEAQNAFPKYSAVAKSGVALITSVNTPVKKLTYEQVVQLLSEPNFVAKDSTGKDVALKVLFDKNNSAVVHYLADSVLKGRKFSPACSILGSSLESINYVAKNNNAVAFVDFAWLSDADDSIAKANSSLIKFLYVNKPGSNVYETPNQSSFKLETYPFTRTVYVYRKTGDFTLAKGFESFVAGPKGQLIFLKQGLLPTRQGERAIEMNTKPLNSEE